MFGEGHTAVRVITSSRNTRTFKIPGCFRAGGTVHIVALAATPVTVLPLSPTVATIDVPAGLSMLSLSQANDRPFVFFRMGFESRVRIYRNRMSDLGEQRQIVQ